MYVQFLFNVNTEKTVQSNCMKWQITHCPRTGKYPKYNPTETESITFEIRE